MERGRFVLTFGEPCAGVHGFWRRRETGLGPGRRPTYGGFCFFFGEPGAGAPGPLAQTGNRVARRRPCLAALAEEDLTPLPPLHEWRGEELFWHLASRARECTGSGADGKRALAHEEVEPKKVFVFSLVSPVRERRGRWC